MNRREFLKYSGLLGTSLLLSACADKFTVSGSEDVLLPFGTEMMSTQEVQVLMETVKRGARDRLAQKTGLVLVDLERGTANIQGEFSELAREPFIFLKRDDNLFSAEAIASRPGKLFYLYEGDLIPRLFIEGFYPALAIPLGQMEDLHMKDEEVNAAVTKELISLGMIEGFSKYLASNEKRTVTVSNVQGTPVANSQTLSVDMEDQLGLSIFFENTTGADTDNEIWKLYDLLPTLTLTAGLKYEVWDKGIAGRGDFQNIPILSSMTDFAQNIRIGEQNMLEFVYGRLYKPITDSLYMRTDPDILAEVLGEPGFVQSLLQFNGAGFGLIDPDLAVDFQNSGIRLDVKYADLV